ncbi:haloacid dehalogenase-like hydrolase [Candidatus Falkowbacteria bacterium]|nr:haloacid dehalogenase-like hydrolase [Candidatus Falkowbacteria bacterium]
MIKNIIIKSSENLEKIKSAMAKDGPEKLHVLSDFDRTLLRAFVDGQKSPSVIAQIRNGKYLTPDYAPRAHALFDKYRPIELDPNLSRAEKSKAMHEWWSEHFKLLAESGLTKQVMQKIVATKTLKFRDGALEFLDFLHERNIPLVIMSGAPGDMIAMYLAQEGRLYDNVYIIAPFLEFDASGKMIGVKEPIVHALNKYEIILKDFPVFEKIKNRQNVLLLGDSLDDVGMVEGFDYKNMLKIGFLNEKVEENLEKFKETFDVVLLGDPGMEYINNLLREMFA